MNKSSFISLNAIVNRIVSVLFGLDYIKENNSERQVIKVDIQIISIAVANRVSKLYTADKGIIEIIDQLDLPIEVINFEKDELLGMTLFESSLD